MADTKTSDEVDASPPLLTDSVRLARSGDNRRTTLAEILDLRVVGHTPSAANDTGVAGTVAWDTSYIYVCVATDTWLRAAIATW